MRSFAIDEAILSLRRRVVMSTGFPALAYISAIFIPVNPPPPLINIISRSPYRVVRYSVRPQVLGPVWICKLPKQVEMPGDVLIGRLKRAREPGSPPPSILPACDCAARRFPALVVRHGASFPIWFSEAPQTQSAGCACVGQPFHA